MIESEAITIPVVVVQRFNDTSAVAWEKRGESTCSNTTNSCTDGCVAVGLLSWSQTKAALTVWNENMESAPALIPPSRRMDKRLCEIGRAHV